VCLAPGLAGLSAPAGATNTSTTLPGPAPNQSQINATQSQVAQIEASLAKEEQETSELDDQYDTAELNLNNVQNALRATDASLVKTRVQIHQDRRTLAKDAVLAYVYATPQSNFSSFFSSATLTGVGQQYTNQVVGNLDTAKTQLQTSESHLRTQETQQESEAAQAKSQASQAASLAAANETEASQTTATLSNVQGQLATEVAQAAVEEAQAEAAAAQKAANAAAAQRAAAAAEAAAQVAGAVGGASSEAAATAAANQAAGNSGSVSGTGSGDSEQMAAVQAAESQLGVPYVYGGESPGNGFDCSGLVQWAWSQAGVSIPRTTETQWPDLQHVSLSNLEPGDLLFYYNLDGDDAVDHVVMYTGSGPYGSNTVIQAPFTGSDVSYSPIFTEGLIGAARP
jgi:peptidoglycan DL-endopeptidase CwlO